MKISCEIIKDLLPLYLDSVCSNDSKAVIDEHLVACENCKAELQAMQNSFSLKSVGENLNEAEAVKNLSKKWKRSIKWSLLKGILITVLVIAALALVSYVFLGIKVIY